MLTFSGVLDPQADLSHSPLGPHLQVKHMRVDVETKSEVQRPTLLSSMYPYVPQPPSINIIPQLLIARMHLDAT